MRSWKCSYTRLTPLIYIWWSDWNVETELHACWRLSEELTNRRLEERETIFTCWRREITWVNEAHLPLTKLGHIPLFASAGGGGMYSSSFFFVFFPPPPTFLHVPDNENEITRSSAAAAATRNVILIHRLAVILIPKKKQLLQLRLANLEKCWSDDFQPKDE